MSDLVRGLAIVASMVIPGAQFLTPYLMAANMVYGMVDGREKARRARNQARDAYNKGLTDRTVTYTDANAPWQIVYGEAVVGGRIVAQITSGDRDQYQHVVVVWADHECDAITEVLLAGVALGTLNGAGEPTGGKWARDLTKVSSVDITLDGSGTGVSPVALLDAVVISVSVHVDGSDMVLDAAELTITGAYTVTVGAGHVDDWAGRTVRLNYSEAPKTPMVRVRHHLGAAGQTADASLLDECAGSWSSTDVLEGKCYSVIRYCLDEPEFQGGPVPPTVRLRGRKVYDPRTLATAWSANAALCTADFITAEFGKGQPGNTVVWASVGAEANVCGEALSTHAGAMRYTCNGAFNTDADPDQTLDALCQAMAGFAAFSGAWRLQAGTYTAPVMALTDADNAGSVELVEAPQGMDIFNGLRGQFYDPARFDQRTDYSPYSNAAFVAADGGAHWGSLNLPFTNADWRAQNLARIFVERSRGMRLVYPAKARARRLLPGQRVTLTCAHLNLSAASFRVIKRDKSRLPVLLTLEQDDPSMWDEADAPAPLASPTAPGRDPWLVDPVEGLTVATGEAVVVRDQNGQVLTRVRVSWTATTDALVLAGGALEIQYRFAEAAEWRRAPDTNAASTVVDLGGLAANRYYLLRARWRNALGAVSDWRSENVRTPADVSLAKLTATPETLQLTASGTTLRVGDFSGAVSTLAVDGVAGDEIADWTITKTDHGVTSALSGTHDQTLSITGFDPLRASADYPLVVVQCHLNGTGVDTSRYEHPDSVGSEITWETDPTSVNGTVMRVTTAGMINNSRITFGPAPELRAPGSWTMRWRCKFRTLPSSGQQWWMSGNYYKMPFFTLGGGGGYTLHMSWTSNGGTVSAGTSEMPIVANQWYLWELSYDAPAGIMRIFRDGAVERSQAVTAGCGDYAAADETLLHRVGCAWTAAGWDSLAGNIDYAEYQYIVGMVLHTAAYTDDEQPFADGAYVGQGWVDVTAARTGYVSLTKRVNVGVVATGADAVVPSLSQPSWTANASATGVVASYAGSAVTMTVSVGTDTSGWTFTHVTSHAGITASLSGGTLTITGFADALDAGYVDITATRPGFVPQTLRYGLSKSKAGDLLELAFVPPTIFVAADWDGIASGLPVASTATIKRNGTDETPAWSASVAATAGITASAGGDTVGVTAMADATEDGVLTVTFAHASRPDLVGAINVQKQRAVRPAQTSNITRLITLEANTAGHVPPASYTGAAATMTMAIGGADDTSAWTYSHLASAGLTVSRTDNVVAITNMADATDSGYIDITATRSGWTTTTERCSVEKIKRLAIGGPLSWTPLDAPTAVGYNGSYPTCSIVVKTDGRLVTSDGLFSRNAGAWHNPVAAGIGTTPGYWVRLTVISGTPTGGITAGTWYALTADRTVSLTPAGTGGVQCELHLDIAADSGGAAIVGGGDVTLYAYYDVI